jgi:RNA polymerase sigma-70 factor (ECF subfamily)
MTTEGTVEGEDDRALLARHVSGDRDAFGVLVARHRDRLWRVALRTLGDPDDAADAVQDALVSAYRAAASFRGEAAVTTWLHRITVNACLDLARRRSSRPTTALTEQTTAQAALVIAPFDATDTAASVLAALRRLPVDQAAAVVIVDVEGFSVREAAEILGAPEGTVKSRCARARARLAELLSDLAPDTRGAPNPVAPNPVAGNPAPPPPVQRQTTDTDTDADREGEL